MSDVRELQRWAVPRGVAITPEAVLCNREGLALSPRRAQQLGIKAEAILVRNDGWTLGFPRKFAAEAYATWPGRWDGFVVLSVATSDIVRPLAEWEDWLEATE